MELVLQVVVCAGGVTVGCYDFVREAGGNVQKVLVRVCNVRNEFLSNLEVEVRVTESTVYNSSQEACAVANVVDDPPAIDKVVAVGTSRLLHRGGSIWEKGGLIEHGAEFVKSMTCSCSNEAFEYTICDMRDTMDETFRAH